MLTWEFTHRRREASDDTRLVWFASRVEINVKL